MLLLNTYLFKNLYIAFLCNCHELYLYLCFILVVFYVVFYIVYHYN